VAFHWIARYTHWLHTRWPAGTVERLPLVDEYGACSVPGVTVVGDLTGVPLLKFALQTGAAAAARIAGDPDFQKARTTPQQGVRDLIIVGGGVAGIAAAVEARRRSLDCLVIEANQPFSTVANFPARKPIYVYPADMRPDGRLQVTADVKEALLDELQRQRRDAGIEPLNARVTAIHRESDALRVDLAGGEPLRARRVIVAIGRSGEFRKLNVPGEELPKVYNRLHDPREGKRKNVLVVGGGDSALEAAIALAEAGAKVTLSYRKPEFSRAKSENVERLKALAVSASDSGSLALELQSRVVRIERETVVLRTADGAEKRIPNEMVYPMIGREAPLDFFRRNGIAVAGEWRPATIASLALFLLFCVWLYHWKSDYSIPLGLKDTFNRFLGLDPSAFWNGVRSAGGAVGTYFNNPATLGGTIAISASGRSFYYTLAYCLCVLIFGIRRIRRRKTPYVTRQTVTLTLIQWIPLFLLPEILLPWMGHNGLFDSGFGGWIADQFFPAVDYGHGREYWRAYGFILAWPLMVWNWFTDQPLWGWLILGFIQTCVLIPLMIRRWGKGAYCGWICSCGALAETMGDTHRHKMPHGPVWNRLNMIGQVFLLWALVILLIRVLGWIFPNTLFPAAVRALLNGIPILNYGYVVDLIFGGILGVGLYFHFSGRVWCRFACPLAALMHIYARFTRFRIFADKKKCISCNVCTSVCHQGIDVMNFANKGEPMQDPQCVRCSACVQSCPTGVLTFGRYDAAGNPRYDPLPASRVQSTEQKTH
jgi:thioredoxin reductase/ferredoxin